MDFENTKKYIKQKLNELKLPFFSILVKKDGKEIFSFTYPSNRSTESLIVMYSMSKVITSTAFMQLVEQGKVKYTDLVSKYIPGYDNLFNMKTGERIKTKMTIEHLLTMTSGLDYDRYRKATLKLKEEKNPSTIEACTSFVQDGILFEPGTQFNYSLSLDVVAAIIEVVSGQKFSDYVDEHIFKPLGMNNSTFKYRPDLIDKCLEEYNCTDEGIFPSESYYDSFFIGPNYESGGAGLISTVSDYSKFIDSLANGSYKIISDHSIKEISTTRVKETPFNESVKEYSKSSVEYGYGFAVRTRMIPTPEGIPVGEFGWDGARGCYSFADPINKISVTMGLTISGWPSYVKNFHLALVKEIYKDIFK